MTTRTINTTTLTEVEQGQFIKGWNLDLLHRLKHL